MTVNLSQLWMPIVLGTVLAWVASALIHMLIKYHNTDYKPLSNEDEVRAAVRKGSAAVGFYCFPFCSDMSEMKNEALQQKFIEGPVGFLAIFPNGMPPMGKLLIQQVLFFLIGCFLIAYCAGLALAPGTEYMTVFRFVATVGFMTFGWAVVPYSIWYGHPWSTTAKYLLDALIYGAVVAGAFAWLWPAAV
ncbi:MAG: hypothetical protein OER80_03115 [Gammaproteobacteria bacterium]|nr:hypothetical protein [Gammaproteobacteria bacterium]